MSELDQKSYNGGPRTPEGKARSCMNALKSALTGRTVLLPGDELERYREHINLFCLTFQPIGQLEMNLVQAIADHDWRLQRICSLEMTIFAQSYDRLAAVFIDAPAAVRDDLIRLETYKENEKTLRNLHIQEMRLRRYREKDTAELRLLQAERIKIEEPLEDSHVQPHDGAVDLPDDYENSFEFAVVDHAIRTARTPEEARRMIRERLDGIPPQSAKKKLPDAA